LLEDIRACVHVFCVCVMLCWSVDSVISQDGETKHMGVDAHRSVCVCVCAGLVPCNRWAELSQIGSWTPGS